MSLSFLEKPLTSSISVLPDNAPDTNEETGFSIEERIGDLFQSQTSLAHCVDKTFHMGAGIAVAFREKFGHVEELRASKTKVGESFAFESPIYYTVTDTSVVVNDYPPENTNLFPFNLNDEMDSFNIKYFRFIYNLVTKHRHTSKPTLLTLRDSLLHMRSHMEKFGVNELSIPRIGCGLDKLNWTLVRRLIKQCFWTSSIKIYVYTKPPKSTTTKTKCKI
jgi:O-acetyl-ADP-ribose deacetylase (regulator of RNase III)